VSWPGGGAPHDHGTAVRGVHGVHGHRWPHGRRGPFGHHGPRGRIFWRIYGHGLLLLLLVSLAVAVAGWALGRAIPTREPVRLASYAAARIGELLDDPPRLASELRHVKDGFGVDLTVYDAAGALLASNVEPPLPPRPPGDFGGHDPGPFHLAGRGFAFAAPLPGGRGHLVMTGAPREGALGRFSVQFAVVLAALALASIPLARSISRPIERLTEAARALGAGDLSVRSRVRVRGEVGELAAAFDDMAARLEALVRGEKELIANVSHELRTPLARMKMALALAEEGDVTRARKALGEIGEDVGELERLTDEILAAARVDLAGAGGLPLHRERIEVEGLVAEAAERFRSRHPGRELSLEVAPGLPALDGDPALLRRLLGNLLDNAAKYSEPPAPVVLVASLAGEGAPGAPPGGAAVALEVRDQGIGVDPADLPHLFTPFFRTDRSRARDSGGVGLGLALARRIAEAHGGRISARAADGPGTVFRVTLPVG
jgi:two-component system, OmpR family, sensor kinase